MKVFSVDLYRDGGSRGVKTDFGDFIIYIKDKQVYDNWPGKGGKLVSSQLQKLIIDVADAFQAGQHSLIESGYRSAYQVRTFFEDYFSISFEEVLKLAKAYEDWIKTK